MADVSISNGERDRPLFEEPTEDLERLDAWEGTPGFVVGGMANIPLRYLAEQYFDAASVLVESIQTRRWEDYRLANPALFLYRHALELLLKAALQGSGRAAKIHRLEDLADTWVAYVKREFGREVPHWITSRIKEIAAIDPGSTAFRYNENKDPTTKRDLPVDGELHVDLLHLRQVMDALKTALTALDDPA